MKTKNALMFSYAGYMARYVYLLILIPFYGRVLGISGYGQVLAAMSLYTVVWVITNYGFSIAGTRNVAMSQDDHLVRAKEFGRHLHARVLMSVVGLAIGIVGTTFSSVLQEQPRLGVVATLLGVAQAFNLGWYFQGLGKFKVSTLLEVGGFVISMTLILLLVRGPHDGIFVLVSLLLSSLITTVASYIIAGRGLSLKDVHVTGGFSLITESTSLFLLGGVVTLFLSGATYLLSLFAGPDVVGAYGSAERLAGIVMALMVPTNQVLLTRISQGMAGNDSERQGFRVMRNSLIVMVSCGGVAAMLVVLLAPFVVPLVLGPQFSGSIRMLQWLACMYPVFAFSQVVNLYILIPLQRDGIAMRMTVLSTLIQVMVFLVLSKNFQGEGAVAARIFGEFLTAGLLAIVVTKLGLWGKIFNKNAPSEAVCVQ